MKRYLNVILFLPVFSLAQIGGQLGFQALNLTSNPRSAALAGPTLSLADGDVSQFFDNPATLDSVKAQAIFFHFNPYFADVSVLSMAYSFDIRKLQGFSIGINYLNYGSFDLTNATGEVLGNFSANDYVITMGKAHRLGPVTLGVNAKFVNTAIDSYSSSALVADIGGLFRINKNWTIAMAFKNMGFVIDKSDLISPSIPFDVRIGTTFKPEYMPLRFSVTSSNLVNENLSLKEESTGRSNEGFDSILKRINLGTELLLSSNLHILFGYNHKRKQELRLDTIGGGAGFSYGLMIKIKSVMIRYSRATYHAAGGSSFISVQTNLNDFKRIL